VSELEPGDRVIWNSENGRRDYRFSGDVGTVADVYRRRSGEVRAIGVKWPSGHAARFLGYGYSIHEPGMLRLIRRGAPQPKRGG